MGLDIIAYSRLRRSPERDHDEDATRFLINEHFPGRADEIDGGVAYEHDPEQRFFIASYSSYNLWRDQLSRLARHDGAFRELIDFSDCEGTLGTAVSGRLLRDFDAHRSDAVRSDLPYFLTIYEKFHQAFAIAANDGAVKFT